MDDTSRRQGTLADEAATLELGAALARALTPGCVLHLHGDLGAGKTTLVRGLLRELGHAGRVKSPTYTLVESYTTRIGPVHHFDLYRFADAEEWIDAGFSELFGADSVCLVEWPDKAGALLPAADLDVALSVAQQGRNFEIKARSPIGTSCLTRL